MLERVSYSSGGIKLPKCPWRPPPKLVLTLVALAYNSRRRRRTACGAMPSLASRGVRGSNGMTVWEVDMLAFALEWLGKRLLLTWWCK